jgi:hypothetical protein
MWRSCKKSNLPSRTRDRLPAPLLTALFIAGVLVVAPGLASAAASRAVGTVTQYHNGEKVAAVSFYLDRGHTTISSAAAAACRSVEPAVPKDERYLSGHITVTFSRAATIPAPITSDIEPYNSTEIFEATSLNGRWMCNPRTLPMISGAAGEAIRIPFVTDLGPSKAWSQLYEHDLEFDITGLTRGQFTLSGVTAATCPKMPTFADSYRLAYFTKPPYPIAVEKPAVRCQSIPNQQRVTTTTIPPPPPPTTSTTFPPP